MSPYGIRINMCPTIDPSGPKYFIVESGNEEMKDPGIQGIRTVRSNCARWLGLEWNSAWCACRRVENYRGRHEARSRPLDCFPRLVFCAR
jgi:hypothetical protein